MSSKTLLEQLTGLQEDLEVRVRNVASVRKRLEDIFQEAFGQPETWRLLERALQDAGIKVTSDQARKFVNALMDMNVVPDSGRR